MARITNRNFLADFATLQVEYGPDQKGPDVSQDIQMVYLMGDVTTAAVAAVGSKTEVAGRAALVAAGTGAFIGAVAGNRAIIELEVVNPGGIVIDGAGMFFFGGSDRNALVWIQNSANTIVTPVVRPPAYEESPGDDVVAPVGIITTGTITNANTPTDVASFGSRGDGLQDLFIRTGQFLACANTSLNFATTVSMRWRELAA